MSDGAHMGITAGRALGTVLGGDDQPTDEERSTAEETRARLEAAPLFEGPKPWDRFPSVEGEMNDAAYSAAADSIAHAFLILLEEDESLLEPRYYPEDCEHEILRGKQKSPDSPFWEAMTDRWPHADDWIGGASGFMVGFALNAALYASGKSLVARNPAIVEVG